MAFGDVRGTLTASSGSITNPFDATGSVAVSVGDLVVALLAQQTNLTVTACSDNLGNTYSAQNAGTDAGAATGRMFYSRVTVAGTLTTISATCTGSTNNVTFPCAVFEGPFQASPHDTTANPANATTDTTSPFTCPASGTMAQADNLVIGWCTKNQNAALTASGSTSLAIAESGQVPVSAIGYQVVAATTSVAPTLAAASDPTQIVLGTAVFKKDTAPIGRLLQIDQSIERAAYW